MNSALRPIQSSSGPQNSSTTTQLNKPMHSQSTTGTCCQTSTNMPQSLVHPPHSNLTVAHNHPNPAHQTNHYLSIPNASQHCAGNNSSIIAVSNHPVPSVTQAVEGQTFSTNKNSSFGEGYQPNLGQPPNQNLIPPVSQTLLATQPPHHSTVATETEIEKQSSDDPSKVKFSTKPESLENHVSSLPRVKSPVPLLSPKLNDSLEEKTTHLSEPVQQKIETMKEGMKSSLPISEAVTSICMSSCIVSNNSSGSIAETKVENQTKESSLESLEKIDSCQSLSLPNIKDKEQKVPQSTKTTVSRTLVKKLKTSQLEGESSKSNKQSSEIKTGLSTQKSLNLITKSKRTRTKTQPYQSPLPEIEIITKISTSTPRSKTHDDKLIVFYKNEFLAVRNSENSFYICQAVQNVYKSSPKIRIRWLSQDKSDKSGEVYTPDFYDTTDFDCILTNLNLIRVDKGKYRLPSPEKERTDSILKRSLAVEKGEVTSPSLTEEHPDGIDLSLYKEESQLKKKKGTKRKASSLLKSENKSSNSPTMSPDQRKVRKIVTKTTNKVTAKRMTVVTSKKTAVATLTSSDETKKSITSSRSDRVKRRSNNQNHNKVSPVVDQKKARVLAKVARKSVVNAKKNPTCLKSKKASKVTSSSSKVQKTSPKAATKKIKRSSRK